MRTPESRRKPTPESRRLAFLNRERVNLAGTVDEAKNRLDWLWGRVAEIDADLGRADQ